MQLRQLLCLPNGSMHLQMKNQRVRLSPKSLFIRLLDRVIDRLIPWSWMYYHCAGHLLMGFHRAWFQVAVVKGGQAGTRWWNMNNSYNIWRSTCEGIDLDLMHAEFYSQESTQQSENHPFSSYGKNPRKMEIITFFFNSNSQIHPWICTVIL